MHLSRRKILERFATLAESRVFSYGLILLLQFRVMLWIWDYRDLTPGDAAEYYYRVHTLLAEGRVDIVWSPLYTVFLAGWYKIFGDPFWVTIIAQVVIALAASLLFLALLRTLLPAWIALAVAAWWAVLPINFDTVYNVHLFAALFPLAMFLVAARMDNAAGRGIVLGGLLLAGLLVRTEYLGLFLIWLVLVIVLERKTHRPVDTPLIPGRAFKVYGAPLLIAVLVAGICYLRATPQFPELTEYVKTKTTLYVCQNYAYSRKQQGDPWPGDPWTECREIVERDFGQPAVSFAEALLLNPERMADHLWWNAQLIPAGTQLALFSRYAGEVNPDFMIAKRSPMVWVPLLLVGGLCLLAVYRRFVRPWFGGRISFPHGQAWLLMASAAALVLGIVLMVRPRPSYMFPYSMFLMALTGLGLKEFLAMTRLEKLVKPLTPIILILIAFFIPSHYSSDYTSQFGYRGQPWRQLYHQAAPHLDRAETGSPAAILIPAGNYVSLCNYLGADCINLPPSGDLPENDVLMELSRSTGNSAGVRPVHVFYHQDMIWKVSGNPAGADSGGTGYIELRCFALTDDLLRCSDGTVDLKRGYMEPGSAPIPLRGAYLVRGGQISGEKTYPHHTGYWLEILVDGGRPVLTLVTDDALFRSDFNQQYLLGNYDRRLFRETYSDFPLMRILQVVLNPARQPETP